MSWIIKSIKGMFINYFKKISFVFLEIYKANHFILLLFISSMVLSGINPLISSYSISKIIMIFENTYDIEYDNKKIYFFTILIILSAILRFFIENIKYLITDTVGFRLSYNIKNIIGKKFQEISQEYMDSPEFLDLYKNAVEKVEYEPINILNNLFNIFSSLISSISFAIIINHFNVLNLLIMLFLSIPIYYFKNKIQTATYTFYKNNTMLFRQSLYYFSLISKKEYAKEIRTSNLSHVLGHRIKELFDILLSKKNIITKKSILYTIFISICSISSLSITMFSLIEKMRRGKIPISQFVLYSSSLISFEMSMLSIAGQLALGNKSMAFLDYLFDFLNIKTNNNVNITHFTQVKKETNHNIQFINVSFKYPGATYYSLKNITFKFSCGESLCFVGENGSGKTTLIKLLLRIYESFEGEILLDGYDIKGYDIVQYRRLFGFTFQDYIKYSTDVKSNIGFGDYDNINNKNIRTSAEMAYADPFIQKYKNGYDTNLSREFYKDGIEPSIGQWQKISVSRAIFSNAPILIFDEPTASLDPKSEEEILKTFSSLKDKKSLLIISHRLCSAKLADKIILLENGQIKEMGTHEELIKGCKTYFKMYNLQANKYMN